MTGLVAWREGVDDDHAAAAAWTGPGEYGRIVVLALGGLGLRRDDAKQRAGAGDVLGTAAVGEQSPGSSPGQAPWRMRWKPDGSTCIRKRRMNSWVGSVMVL